MKFKTSPLTEEMKKILEKIDREYNSPKKCSVCDTETKIENLVRTPSGRKIKAPYTCLECDRTRKPRKPGPKLSEEEKKEKRREYRKIFYSNPENIAKKAAYQKKYTKEYRRKNKEKEKKRHEEWKINRREVYLAGLEKQRQIRDSMTEEEKEEKKVQQQDWYYSRGGKEKCQEHSKKNRKRITQRTLEKRRSCPQLKIKERMGNRIRTTLKRKNLKKQSRTSEIIGGAENFIKHIETLWLPGMSWENHAHWDGKDGTSVWHIDHIKPISSFDLTDEKQLKECFHYSNCQPLWAVDNLRKSAKIE